MQIASVATVSGWITSLEPSRIATVSGFAQRLVAVDVLDRHGGVVDQHADGQREAAQRHQVDRVAGQEQADDAGEDRQRDRRRDDHRVAPASQEHQDHQRDQDRRDDRLADHVLDCAAHEHRLVEVELQFETRRRRRLRSRAAAPAWRRPPRASRRRHASGSPGKLARLPLTWTMLVCVAKLSLTCATSPSRTGTPSRTPTGRRVELVEQLRARIELHVVFARRRCARRRPG